jgi:hypothetical protein
MSRQDSCPTSDRQVFSDNCRPAYSCWVVGRTRDQPGAALRVPPTQQRASEIPLRQVAAASSSGSSFAPPLFVHCFTGELPVLGKAFCDSRSELGSTRGATGAGITPGGLCDCPLSRLRAVFSVGSAVRAQGRVGGGVSAGLGEDVASVAEGVSPGPETEGCVLGEAAEAPASAHEGADMFVDGGRPDAVPGSDAVVDAGAGLPGALRNVLRHVRGHSVIVGPVVVGSERSGVDLGAPGAMPTDPRPGCGTFGPGPAGRKRTRRRCR